MKNRMISSLFFIMLGALLILFPMYILPVCPLPEPSAMPVDTMSQAAGAAGSEHMHSAPAKIMRCFWTLRAELGIGSLVIAVGVLMLFSRTIFVRMGLTMSLACISLLAAAIPTILIGVCPNEMMRCNMGAKPALVLLSGLSFVVSIINLVYLNKISKRYE